MKQASARIWTRAPDALVEAAMLTSYEFTRAWLLARCRTDRGASLVEYALLVALIAVICVAAVTLIGRRGSSKLSSAGTSLG